MCCRNQFRLNKLRDPVEQKKAIRRLTTDNERKSLRVLQLRVTPFLLSQTSANLKYFKFILNVRCI